MGRLFDVAPKIWQVPSVIRRDGVCTASTGLWRVLAWRMAGKSRKTAGGWVETRFGRFKVTDFVSYRQLCFDYELGVKAQVAKCAGLFVDVGANIGLYSVMAARWGKPVVALEPGRRAYAVLLDNLRLNGLAGTGSNGVVALNVAAWSRRELLRLGVSKDDSQESRITGADGGEVVSGQPLDEVLQGRRELVDTVKIDVEGSEPEVLKGMAGILNGPAPPRVIFEALTEQKLARCSGMLEDVGYRVNSLRGYNYLALPCRS